MHHPNNVIKTPIKFFFDTGENKFEVLLCSLFPSNNNGKLAGIIGRITNALNRCADHFPIFFIECQKNQVSLVFPIGELVRHLVKPFNATHFSKPCPRQEQIKRKVNHAQHPINIKQNNRINHPKRFYKRQDQCPNKRDPNRKSRKNFVESVFVVIR